MALKRADRPKALGQLEQMPKIRGVKIPKLPLASTHKKYRASCAHFYLNGLTLLNVYLCNFLNEVLLTQPLANLNCLIFLNKGLYGIT